jgi:hypothetical protein
LPLLALLITGMISIFLTIAKLTPIELLIFSRLRFHTSIQQRPIVLVSRSTLDTVWYYPVVDVILLSYSKRFRIQSMLVYVVLFINSGDDRIVANYFTRPILGVDDSRAN